MTKTIAISSGKGGTGKTFISTNIAKILDLMKEKVRYLDCDVEEPNGHLFLKPVIDKEESIMLLSPAGVDAEKCTACGKCADVCKYNAIAKIKDEILFFKNQCHLCGGCKIVCPHNAIIETDRKIGELKHGYSGRIAFHYGLLETGEGGMSPRLIKQVKGYAGKGINILDSAPGTSCPVVETVQEADLCVLVTDPTPFGVYDLKLAVIMCRKLEQEPVILVNQADYLNNDLKDYCRKAELEIIGEIPSDRRIAECYSNGRLAVEEISDYHGIFQSIALKIINIAQKKRKVRRIPVETLRKTNNHDKRLISAPRKTDKSGITPMKELVVLSGKGGTGKTSLTACFSALEENIAISDCDVDAADLHLVLRPEIMRRGNFSGGEIAEINIRKCTGCGLCIAACRFGAIQKASTDDGAFFKINKTACEGCGVCSLVCSYDAIGYKAAINGEWFLSMTRFGPMAHAKLGAASENSGKLVSLVKDKRNEHAALLNLETAISDGSPGTGCPVIASITGADYVLVVTEPTVSGIHDLKRILDVINFFKIPAGIVVNKYDLNLLKSSEINRIAEKGGHKFHGTIPYNRCVTNAQMKGLSVVEYIDNNVTSAIKKIWSSVKKSCFINREKEEEKDVQSKFSKI